ncbi:MAG: hypothetical protein LBT64_01840 [Puniceicoccales bacterium]|jgi:hypothetical protein|nr:hypothetical protein [Puniceicoccales bacterium]
MAWGESHGKDGNVLGSVPIKRWKHPIAENFRGTQESREFEERRCKQADAGNFIGTQEM